MTLRIAFLLAALALLGATGCSDDDARRPDEGATSGDAVAVEFHRRGEALCRRLARDAVGQQDAGTRSPRAAAAGLRRALAASARFYRRLGALDAPPVVAGSRRDLLALERRDDQAWRRVVARLEDGAPLPQAIEPDAAEIARNRRRADDLYTELGLTGCTSEALADSLR